MRKNINNQLGFETPSIADIEFDLNSRHEIVPILMGLQHIYKHPRTMNKILKLIEQDIIGDAQTDKGAPGLDYWEIHVLAAVRLGCDIDFDALVDLSNNHRKLRQMMGISEWENKTFARSTINDNLRKLTPETLRSINEVLVDEGHKLEPNAIEDVRGDSFVVQTNIAYPIDSRLVFDGLRKTLQFLNQLDNLLGTTTWRQYKYHVRQAKRQLRRIEKAAKSRKSNAEVKFKEQIEIFLKTVYDLLVRAYESVGSISPQTTRKYNFELDDLMDYLLITEYLCDLTERRVLQGDKNIPRDEKIFSVFEPHTELINRGKTPLPIEYGHRVLVIEDKKGFIVDYEVMAAGLTDEKILIEVMSRLQKRMNNRIKSASFDKGFYTPINVKELETIVEVACLPKNGKRSGVAKEREGRPEFITARKRHAGIESAIHALIAGNGLAVCRDKGEDGYHRYVGLAIVGRNLQALGTILLKKARRKQIVQRKAA